MILHDTAVLKRFGERYKLTYFKTGNGGNPIGVTANGAHDGKLSSALSRARARVHELAACNPWEYFVTLTLDPAKYDRHSLGVFQADLSQWIRNQRRLHGVSFGYLLIPEMHLDGCWHMHGLVSGLRSDALEKNSNGWLDYPPYREKFGWISLSRVRNAQAVAVYVCKYISKGLAARKNELGAHLYYASRGLLGAEVIDRGTIFVEADFHKDFENDYLWSVWLDRPVALQHLTDP